MSVLGAASTAASENSEITTKISGISALGLSAN
jgi:hypothetical protein